MGRTTGPICSRCGDVVAVVTFMADPDGEPDVEVALCPDCVTAVTPERWATVLPFDLNRPRRGPRRRPPRPSVGQNR